MNHPTPKSRPSSPRNQRLILLFSAQNVPALNVCPWHPFRTTPIPALLDTSESLLDLGSLALEVVAGNQVGDVVIILVFGVLTLLFLHGLVALGKLAEGC